MGMSASMNICFAFGLWWLVGYFVIDPNQNCISSGPIIYYGALSIQIFCIVGFFATPIFEVGIKRWSSNNQESDEESGGENMADINPGLSFEMLKLIDEFKFIKGMTTLQDPSCVICLGEYIEGDNIKCLPGCAHHFHSNCINDWLKNNRKCPLCLRDVEKELERLNKTETSLESTTKPSI